MRYECMLPHQIRTAIEKNTPVLLAIGVLEYHAEHLSLGVDAHIIRGVLERIEKDFPEVILLPTFYYNTASYAVAGPEKNGGINFDSNKVQAIAEDLFTGLLETGFRNIHGFVWHQSENFFQGMPGDLSFRSAGRRCIFEYLEKKEGRGWWGNEKSAAYYEGDNPFDWIRIHPLANAETFARYKMDHAGKSETELMMALYPDEVDLSKHDPSLWYSRSAVNADINEAEAILQEMYDNVKNIITNTKTDAWLFEE